MLGLAGISLPLPKSCIKQEWLIFLHWHSGGFGVIYDLNYFPAVGDWAVQSWIYHREAGPGLIYCGSGKLAPDCCFRLSYVLPYC